jgi:ABC-type multidrug transport system fused ATPase/permease subunit
VWNNLWNVIWLIFVAFAFVSYLFALFAVIGDLFRDHKLNGWWKALWVLFLVFLPFVTVLVYLIARGRGMAERGAKAAQTAQDQTDAYIRSVAATSPTDEISRAKGLLDSGAISQAEFEALKAKALA